MTADTERKLNRWMTEFNDEYLSGNCVEYRWREVNDNLTFSFAYQVTGGSILMVTVEGVTTAEIEKIDSSILFASMLQAKLTNEFLDYFYRKIA